MRILLLINYLRCGRHAPYSLLWRRWGVGIANHINAQRQHRPSDLGKAQRHHAPASSINHFEGRRQQLELLVGIAMMLSGSLSCLSTGRISRHDAIAASRNGVGQRQLLVQDPIGLDVELFVVQGGIGVVEFFQGRADGLEAGLGRGDGRVEFCACEMSDIMICKSLLSKIN